MRRSKKSPPFVMLLKKMVEGSAWRSLTVYEQAVYVYLKARYNGSNNGDIVLTYLDLKGRLAPATVSRAIKGLVQKQWIKKKQLGGMYRRINKYELTGLYDEATRNYGG